MMRLIFRAMAIGLLRFSAIIVLILGFLSFDVSPLPEWSLQVFAYMVGIGVSYAFARWVFFGSLLTWPRVVWTGLVIILWHMLLEIGLQYSLAPRLIWQAIATYAHWVNLVSLLAYAVGIALAGWQKIRQASVGPRLP